MRANCALWRAIGARRAATVLSVWSASLCGPNKKPGLPACAGTERVLGADLRTLPARK